MFLGLPLLVLFCLFCSFSMPSMIWIYITFAFPEIYLSDREIRDDSDVVFPVNQLLFQQRHSEVEIYRCRADLSATPQYRAYLEKANRLRARFRDIMLWGQMTDEPDLIKKTDAVVLSNIFRLGDHVAVILTQSSKTLAFVEINLTKYQLVDFGSICDDVEIRGEKVSLPCDSLAILLLHESDSL